MSKDMNLLADVKVRLGVTWNDEQTDARLAALIDEGIAYIDSKIGAAGDYQNPGYARTLLMEYVRYARDEALDVFESNYLPALLAARNERQVAEYGKKNAVPAEK